MASHYINRLCHSLYFYIQQLASESVFSTDPGPKAIYKVENKKRACFDI